MMHIGPRLLVGPAPPLGTCTCSFLNCVCPMRKAAYFAVHTAVNRTPSLDNNLLGFFPTDLPVAHALHAAT